MSEVIVTHIAEDGVVLCGAKLTGGEPTGLPVCRACFDAYDELRTEALVTLVTLAHYHEILTGADPIMPCPDCRDGKHHNCAGFAFDSNDNRVPCPCRAEACAVTENTEDWL